MSVQDCLITVPAANYKEMPGSPTTSGTWTEFHASRTYRVVWEDRHTLARDIIGYRSAGVLHRPQQYEEENSNTPIYGVYAQRATIDPIIGLNATTGSYEFAKVTIEYGVPEYNVQDVRTTTGLTSMPNIETYVTESLEPAGEFLTLTHDGLYWYNGTMLQATEAPALMMRYTDWVYTLHQIEYLPAEWFYLPGYVNDAPVYSRRLNKWFAAETLRCGTPTMERETTSIGTGLWSVTFRFTHRNMSLYSTPLGWNHFPQTNYPGADVYWSRIYVDATHTTAKYFYPLANFSQVIA